MTKQGKQGEAMRSLTEIADNTKETANPHLEAIENDFLLNIKSNKGENAKKIMFSLQPTRRMVKTDIHHASLEQSLFLTSIRV